MSPHPFEDAVTGKFLRVLDERKSLRHDEDIARLLPTMSSEPP